MVPLVILDPAPVDTAFIRDKTTFCLLKIRNAKYIHVIFFLMCSFEYHISFSTWIGCVYDVLLAKLWVFCVHKTEIKNLKKAELYIYLIYKCMHLLCFIK